MQNELHFISSYTYISRIFQFWVVKKHNDVKRLENIAVLLRLKPGFRGDNTVLFQIDTKKQINGKMGLISKTNEHSIHCLSRTCIYSLNNTWHWKEHTIWLLKDSTWNEPIKFNSGKPVINIILYCQVYQSNLIKLYGSRYRRNMNEYQK